MLPQPLILLTLFPLFQAWRHTPSPEAPRSPELGWARELEDTHFPLSPIPFLVWSPTEDWEEAKTQRFYHILLDFPLALPIPKEREEEGDTLFPRAQLRRWKAKGRDWVRDLLLPHLVRESARLAPDPGPGRRGMAGLPFRRGRPQRWRTFRTQEARGLPAFGFFELGEGGEWERARLERWGFPSSWTPRKEQVPAWTPAILDRQWKAYERLLQELLGKLRWPLPKLPARWHRVLLPDDGLDRGGIEAHEALDLGALIQRDDGRFGVWAEGVPVSSPLLGGRAIPAPRKDGRGFALRLQRDGFRLDVLVFLYHLAPKGPPRLEGFSREAPLLGWERRDPAARLAQLPKGNHAHLELLGPFRGNKRLFRLFLAHRFKRAMLVAKSIGPERSPLLLPRRRGPGPWAKGRSLLARTFQTGLESPPPALDPAFWRLRLRPVLPFLPPNSRMDTLLKEFLPPLLQLQSR